MYRHNATEVLYEKIGQYQDIDGSLVLRLRRKDGLVLEVPERRLHSAYTEMDVWGNGEPEETIIIEHRVAEMAVFDNNPSRKIARFLMTTLKFGAKRLN